MGEVFFVRHGQASYGASNYDKLSDLGHQQSRWLGDHLAQMGGGFDKVVCGSLRRHQETSGGILAAFSDHQLEIDERLNEMSYFDMERHYSAENGDKVPQTQAELAAQFGRVMGAWERGEISGLNETFDDFQARILSALDEYSKSDQRVLLISSGGPKGIIMRHVLGFGSQQMTDVILSVYNASYSRFAVRAEGLRLLQFNMTPHLDHPERVAGRTML